MRQGSPPRVRGKGNFGLDFCVIVGITPACAGKRTLCATRPAPAGDHPRVCGEKEVAVDFQRDPLGSPPRVRGKVRPENPPFQAVQDHPRVCGEKRVSTLRFMRKEGSPPRVRGKDVGMMGESFKYGITPACAGKSPCAKR